MKLLYENVYNLLYETKKCDINLKHQKCVVPKNVLHQKCVINLRYQEKNIVLFYKNFRSVITTIRQPTANTLFIK